ncbi:hypothetical protein CF54_39105 [Streptomyces sp. Tu 6176]|uniref:hypothetical protein n=1 Tax=Streptomyces sp. Tu 6176 TaxID=1470557 RepID=UPI000450E88A|nr:hypothetical protein [Streptomyces sp. Tu 6176]EYT78123.1 hypothetical protein CF54_39105 [Streptomyces sp. Tu 6176]
MAEQRPSDHHVSGRLLAALWTLRLLAGRPGEPPEPDELLVKEMPMDFLGEELSSVMDHLMTARRRGGGHWKAAAETFRELPGPLLPRRIPGHTMSPGEQRAFVDGYAEQRTAYAEKYGHLVAG